MDICMFPKLSYEKLPLDVQGAQGDLTVRLTFIACAGARCRMRQHNVGANKKILFATVISLELSEVEDSFHDVFYTSFTTLQFWQKTFIISL